MRAAAVLLLPMVLGAQRAPRWTLLPEERIGGVEKGDAYDLPRVAAVVPGPNGSIYVVEPTTQTIRVFDAGGTHVRTIGRRGAGPGEFNVIGGLGFIADTLWTFDLQLRRVSLFSADGTFIQTVPPELSTPVVGGADVMFVSVLAVLPNGHALGRGSYPLAAVASGRVNTTALLLMTRGGRTLDTIARIRIPAARPSRKRSNVFRMRLSLSTRNARRTTLSIRVLVSQPIGLGIIWRAQTPSCEQES